MFRVVNVSDRTVSVGGVRIKPLETYIFNENELSQSSMNRITGLVAIGVLKMYKVEDDVTTVSVEETTTKKGKRK